MSRERQQYKRLLRTLGADRLTLGHPRQSDLLAYVGTKADLALDLSPRGGLESKRHQADTLHCED